MISTAKTPDNLFIVFSILDKYGWSVFMFILFAGRFARFRLSMSAENTLPEFQPSTSILSARYARAGRATPFVLMFIDRQFEQESLTGGIDYLMRD